jgi:uncharacterized small protein (DUF1192 family)
MIEDPAEPRSGRGAALTEIEREDLDIYGVNELKERIERLRAEVERTEGKLQKKESGKSAADALFKF